MFRTALHILAGGLLCTALQAQESQINNPAIVISLSLSFIGLAGYLALTGPLGEMKERTTAGAGG